MPAQPAPFDPDHAIGVLGLQPHPEGGWFGVAWRTAPEGERPRGAASSIYYLLRSDERSHWHRIDALEVWVHHRGGPLQLTVDGEPPVVLGADLAAGQRPQHVVPAGAWQAARPLGGAVLASCVVVPAYEEAGFELAPAGWEPPSGR